MRRREFLNLLGTTSLTGVTACTLPAKQIANIGEKCAQPIASDSILRIDMHCHLMNLKDANSTAFVTRRFLRSSFFDGEGVPKENGALDFLKEVFATVALTASQTVASLSTHTADAETRYLARTTSDYSPRTFCIGASERQRGVFLSDDFKAAPVGSGDEWQNIPIGEGRTTGFLSNRLRNAAFMMAQWDQVDIFTPSMVDFYEGTGGGSAEKPSVQVEFYHQLNLATRGRFLPLVSFNPVRQIEEKENDETPLDLVRRAITELGFIGVKVHPSSGFDPLNNVKYGCLNGGAWSDEGRLDEEVGKEYDQAMRELYGLCRELQVPILTHNSDGLAAEPGCMQNGDKPLEWTASSDHWIKAVEKYGGGDLKVCLAHFASRFQSHLRARSGSYGENEFPVEYEIDDDGFETLVPSSWLDAAVKDIETNPGSGIWLDLSHLADLIYSAALKEEAEKLRSESEPGISTSQLHLFRLTRFETPAGRYANAFMRFLAKRTELHDKLMAGTDWHMPEVSTIGNRYLELLEGLLPKSSRENIMGLNAVRFFGLHEGGGNRVRLMEYYREFGIPLEEVKWMDRVDSRWT